MPITAILIFFAIVLLVYRFKGYRYYHCRAVAVIYTQFSVLDRHIELVARKAPAELHTRYILLNAFERVVDSGLKYRCVPPIAYLDANLTHIGWNSATSLVVALCLVSSHRAIEF